MRPYRKACIFYVTVFLFMAFANASEFTYVVSPSKDFEHFYLKFNGLMGVKNVKLNFKKHIVCKAIFKSPYIPTKNDVEVVDDSYADNKILPGLFRPKNNWHMFEGPSYELLVNVSVLQTVREEAVFPCLVKVKKTNELKLYLVSGLYDFNRGMKKQISYMSHPTKGRFVFEYNEKRNLASLAAIAEEAAPLYNLPKPPSNDLKEYSAVINRQSRAICDFTTGRKLRLCAVGLNGQHLVANTYGMFFPLEDRIEPQCKNITANFNEVNSGWYVMTDIWAIGCHIEPDGEEEFFETYYISFGSEPHHFIIYRKFKPTFQFYSYLDEDNSV